MQTAGELEHLFTTTQSSARLEKKRLYLLKKIR
jgi:hypothetical protein